MWLVFKNQVTESPVELEQVDLWSEITPPPPRAFARVGPKGRLFTQDGQHHGIVVGASGGFVYVRFDHREARVDSGVRTTVQFQTIPLDREGRALVIGGDGERLYVVDRDARATSIGASSTARFTHAAWLSFGFATLDRDGFVTLYRWSDDSDAVPIARFRFERSLASFDAPSEDVLLITQSAATLLHVREDGSARELARFERDLLTSFQCTDESGRHMCALREGHVTEGGTSFRVAALDAAIAMRDALPERERVAEDIRAVRAAQLTRGADLEPAPSGDPPPSKSPSATSAQLSVERLPRFTRALVRTILESPLRDAPDESAQRLLAYPMPADLRAYITARATRSLAHLSVYEAWLDSAPREQNDIRARREGRGSVSLSLGTIANGDPIFAVLRGDSAVIVELAHDEDAARTFASFEQWLMDVCRRAEDNEQTHGLEALL